MKPLALCFTGYIFLLASCNIENELNSHEFNSTHELVQDSKLIIPIDASTELRTRNLLYYKNDSTNTGYLAYENREQNSLHFYNLNNKELEFKIDLKEEGDQGIGIIAGFLIKNLDSIYLANTKRRSISLINRTGNVIKRYSLQKEQIDFNSVFTTYRYRPMFFGSNSEHLYAVCQPDNDYNSTGYWDGYIAGKLNLKSAEIDYIFKAPEEYHKGIYGPFFSHHSIANNGKDTFVYSFPFDEEILVTDYINPAQKHYAGSKYFGSTKGWKKSQDGKELKFYIESNSYREIVYDKWRDVYYRFAYRKVDMVSPSGETLSWNDKIPSIIILNSEFQKIGETDLPVSTHYTRNYFVSPEGLYISNNHLKNPEINEDLLSFTLFKLNEQSL